MGKETLNIIIGGLQKSSLIDYPGKISAIIFTQGCNFRCPYCHNPELITGNSEQKIENDSPLPSPLRTLPKERLNIVPERSGLRVRVILKFLETRRGKLDGVVITGGEPTLHKSLPEFIRQIKGLGFCVKLDTNGTNPDMLQKLIEENLIDYVAMDIKAPVEKYHEVTCCKLNTENILKSIEILKNSSVEYEFRTTVVKSQLAIKDFEQIGKMIAGAPKYYLQRFLPTKTLDNSFLDQKTYSDEEFLLIIEILHKYIQKAELR